MALSILWCGNLTYGLWDSEKDKFILTGTEEELAHIKDNIEIVDQRRINREHFKALREQYLRQIMQGGSSEEKATTFLKEKMPYLWD
jgi:AAA+ ATPase superfamily predicted ATPase